MSTQYIRYPSVTDTDLVAYSPANPSDWIPPYAPTVPTNLSLAMDDLASGMFALFTGLNIAAVIQVNQGGNDAIADGSLIFPFATVMAAVNSTQAANAVTNFGAALINIASGFYSEDPAFVLKDNIYLNGQGVQNTIIEHSDGSAIHWAMVETGGGVLMSIENLDLPNFVVDSVTAMGNQATLWMRNCKTGTFTYNGNGIGLDQLNIRLCQSQAVTLKATGGGFNYCQLLALSVDSLGTSQDNSNTSMFITECSHTGVTVSNNATAVLTRSSFAGGTITLNGANAKYVGDTLSFPAGGRPGAVLSGGAVATNITVQGLLNAPDGSVSVPSLSIGTQANNGFYSVAGSGTSKALRLSLNGIDAAQMDSNTGGAVPFISMLGSTQFQAVDGSQTHPSISFASQSNQGFYQAAGGGTPKAIRLALDGHDRMFFDNNTSSGVPFVALKGAQFWLEMGTIASGAGLTYSGDISTGLYQPGVVGEQRLFAGGVDALSTTSTLVKSFLNFTAPQVDTVTLKNSHASTLSISSAAGASSGDSGQEISIVSGDGNAGANGGAINITAGNGDDGGGGPTGNGGSIQIQSGDGSVSGIAGDAGNITLQGGSSTSGAAGNISLIPGLDLNNVQGNVTIQGTTVIIPGTLNATAITVDSLTINNSLGKARYFGSATSISSALATIVWSTQDYDSNSAMASGVYTIPSAGKYQVNSALLIAGTISLNNNIIIEIQKNNSVVSRRTEFLPAGLTDGKIMISDIINCAANDTIRIQVSTTVGTPSIVASNFDNYISIAFIGT